MSDPQVRRRTGFSALLLPFAVRLPTQVSEKPGLHPRVYFLHMVLDVVLSLGNVDISGSLPA